MKRHVIVLSLESLTFATKYGGSEKLKDRTAHTLTSVLIWPRTGFASRTYARTVEIDGAQATYGAEDFCKAILLKETVQAPSALILQLSVPLSDSAVASFLRNVGKSAIGAVADAADKAVGGLFGDLVAAPIDALAASVADWQPETVGEGTLLLSDELLSGGGHVTMELRAVKDRYTTRSASSSKSMRPATRKKVLKKGDLIATVQLGFQKVE